MKPLAILTMVYNERLKLPYWLSHYEKQVGLQHCYVVDHGSNDGSTCQMFGASKIFLPRSAQDNDLRLKLISDLTRGLLNYYKMVAYVDADELLVADPAHYSSLVDYASRTSHPVVTSIGLEVCQSVDDESSLMNDIPIGKQRSFALYSSSMCKANLVSRPVAWAPGWHAYDGPPTFDNLYLFHLRHADLEQAIERLEITRSMPWARDNAGLHQKVTNQEMLHLVRQFGERQKLEPEDFLSSDSPLLRDLQEFEIDCVKQGDSTPYYVPLARYGQNLIKIPARFKEALSAPMF